MELLNNIWNALSTPNEGLINIITIPIFFLEAFLLMSLFLTILDITATKFQKIIYIILATIIISSLLLLILF